MIKRYNSRRIFTNTDEKYQKMFEDRNVKQINQYDSPSFTYPDADAYDRITTVEHVWSVGDRFYKLANEYYGDPQDWWIIAKFNNLPTEAHLKLGDVILIPTPLHEVLNLLKG